MISKRITIIEKTINWWDNKGESFFYQNKDRSLALRNWNIKNKD